MGSDLPLESELLYMKKMNMVEKYNAVVKMLNGETVEGFTLDDAKAFLNGRAELAAKKNASGGGERKPTAQQIANEGIKATIVATLTETPMTIGDIGKANTDLAELSNQRMSALLTQLVNSGAVVRTEVKGKAYFAILPHAED